MEWYYAKDGQQAGPVGADEIRNLKASGALSDSDLVWNESMTEWTPLGSVSEFSSSAPAAGAPATGAPATGVPATGAPAAGAPEAAPETASDQPAPALSPAPATAPADGQKVPTYLWQSIVCLVFCCLPAAIPALIFATKVEPAQARGDFAAAQDASAKARMWCWIAFGLGLVGFVLYVGLGVIGALSEA